MKTKFLRLGAIVLLCAAVGFAADVSGKWSADVPTRGETVKTTFMLKVDGEALTGTVESPQGSVAIANGKVSGDTISFTVEGQGGGSTTFEGTISGDEIKFKRTGRRGQPREFTATRVK